MADPTLKQLQEQLNALQGQWTLKFGLNPANVTQQDPTLGTGAVSQLQRPHCVASRPINQTLNSGTPTVISFTADVYNPLQGMHDAVGDPTNFHIPVGGVYLVQASLEVDSVNIGDTIVAFFKLNGAIYLPTGASLSPGQVNVPVNKAAWTNQFPLIMAARLTLGDALQVNVTWTPNGGGASTTGGGTMSVTQIF